LAPAAEPLAEEDLLEPGMSLGGYRIEALLGHGGMGVVYRAIQTSLGRPVALKVLVRRLSRDETFVHRFDREASALAALSHPNIVAIYDKGAAEERYYFAMELVDGVSLRHVLTAKAISPLEVLSAVPELCSALEYAHARGILHRDIKPENLIVSKDGRIKIADFGLARLMGVESDGALTQTRTVMGTRDYMAPEARQSTRQADHRSDLYALGVVLYEMLTGKLPLGSFPPPSEQCGVDARVDAVILKALHPDPERRWQRASDIAEALAAVSLPSKTSFRSTARALLDLERPSVLAVSSAPPPPMPAAGKSDPAREPPRRTVSRLLARHPGEGRRRWRARVRAPAFLALGLMGLGGGTLLFRSPERRLGLGVLLGLATLMASGIWWWKRPRA
jgi:serine/threonine-protein kinase